MRFTTRNIRRYFFKLENIGKKSAEEAIIDGNQCFEKFTFHRHHCGISSVDFAYSSRFPT